MCIVTVVVGLELRFCGILERCVQHKSSALWRRWGGGGQSVRLRTAKPWCGLNGQLERNSQTVATNFNAITLRPCAVCEYTVHARTTDNR